ncbi:hypothetical protein B4U79_09465 [Dinothrombium tinctorium]|uniref:Proteasome subunit beta type-1-like protein n=1 Tax=Dinothrombium tinctorium TaxID=1965070 RepID=A0A3S3QEY5_9ACAR|nr:hypothetical protein B4U79_09465 [Dinothrombium tinctorium]
MQRSLNNSETLSGIIQKPQFSPYTDNGGTVIAVGGKGFVIIGCDSRLSSGYTINTRFQPKLFKLTPQTVLGSAGCWCDVLTFVRLIEARLKMYSYEHNKTMSTPATAQLVSIMLYYKRFFPYYVSNLVAGLDEEGNGVVYSYDPVGHCEQSTYCATGSSSAFIQPLLDNYVGKKNIANAEKGKLLTQEEALRVVNDAFVSATERNMYCGDSIILNIITEKGIEERVIPLRKD